MSSAVGPSKAPFIRQCTLFDVEELALTMRREDVEEIHHASRSTPREALLRGYHASEVLRTIERGGKVVAIFGVVGVLGRAGSPWMLGTDDLPRCRSLLRECRARLEQYTIKYHHLTNSVWAKNTVHIEWIKWLGFQFDGSDLRNGETFLHFHRSAHV